MGDSLDRYEFRIKDYRILRDAVVRPSKITLIYGKNGHGKSSLVKSLVSLLSNRHSEDNFRHGRNSYSISARVGDNTIEYKRVGSTSTVRFNDEAVREKIGQGTLFQVEPRFPLKRFDLEETSFYPNFSFQNETLFDRIDPSQLFSVMFTDVARLSERVTQLKRDCVNTAKVKNDSQVNTDLLKEKVSASRKSVDKIKAENPGLDASYTFLKGLVAKRDEQAKFLAEYTLVSTKCSDPNKRALVALYKDAQPLFSDFTFMQGMRGVLSQLEKTKVDLGLVHAQNTDLRNAFPMDVYPLVSGVRQMSTYQQSLTSIHIERDATPDVSPGLVSSGVTLISLRKTLEGLELELKDLPVVSNTLISEVRDLARCQSELHEVRADLEEVDFSYDRVMQELRSIPCQRYVDNLCPFQDQIKL